MSDEISVSPREGLRWNTTTRLLRFLSHRRLDRIRDAELILIESDHTLRFGIPLTGEGLRATVTIHDPRAYQWIVRRGSIGAAEAYMRGLWTCDDLVALFRIFTRHAAAASRVDAGVARLSRSVLKLAHWARRNSRRGARRNIEAHYDLGNDFFELFLDPTLTYSCGVFERPESSLEEASLAKYERICRKLGIESGDRVLEIGGGWGGFALHAAARHGAQVRTATISRAQANLARERAERAGLSDRIEVVEQDYRSLNGLYDKLVSIEMIEAVGWRHLERFFRICCERLKPDGLMALQAIIVPEQRYEDSKRSVDFIKRYIFPGGCLVSVGAIARAVARATDFRLVHFEDLSSHYARTLAEWRRNLLRNWERARTLGRTDPFLRMWEVYLTMCQAGFEERYNGVVQMVLARGGNRPPAQLGEAPA